MTAQYRIGDVVSAGLKGLTYIIKGIAQDDDQPTYTIRRFRNAWKLGNSTSSPNAASKASRSKHKPN